MLDIDKEVLKQMFDSGDTIRNIARHFGCSEHTIYKKIKKIGLQREKILLYEDIAGQKYNKLTAIKFIALDKFGKALWLFLCECGREKKLNASAVKANLTTSCGCVKRKYLRRMGYELLSHAYIKKLKKSALSRNYTFDLELKYLWELYIQQEKKCALSGVDITIYPDSNKERLMTASLDRIDSKIGYIRGNVQWVHKRINRIKNILTTDELLFWSKKIVENSKFEVAQQYDVNILTWD